VDVHHFFSRRVAFIRQFYKMAAAPFLDRKRKIEAGDCPFDDPPHSEVLEPPYLNEWTEADESLQVLGYTCVSMLAAALHVYFQTWERLRGIPAAERFKDEFRGGWVSGYRTYCDVVLRIDLSKGPCDLKLIEEIVLARNRSQHHDTLVMTLPTYKSSDLQKLPRALFIDSTREAHDDLHNGEREWLMLPTLRVSGEKLDVAIADVERFVDWLDPLIERAVFGR
jgi:hypothetical protein